MNRVGVVILHWFTEQDTIECLRSVLSSRDVELRVYIVDNGSTQQSRDHLEKGFPSVVFLGSGKNIGYSAGANLGAHRALNDGCSFVFLLNNDTVLAPDCLETLLRSPGGIINPRILSFQRKGKVWFDGGRFSFSGRGIHINRGKRAAKLKKGGEIEPSEFATGCAMLVHKEVFAKIGFFNEDFYAYSEDLDYSLRARSAGIGVCVDHRTVVYHKQSRSVIVNAGKGFRDYYVLRNTMFLLKRHYRDKMLFLRFVWLLMREYAAPALTFITLGQWRRAAALTKALRDGLAGKNGKGYESS